MHKPLDSVTVFGQHSTKCAIQDCLPSATFCVKLSVYCLCGKTLIKTKVLSIAIMPGLSDQMRPNT